MAMKRGFAAPMAMPAVPLAMPPRHYDGPLYEGAEEPVLLMAAAVMVERDAGGEGAEEDGVAAPAVGGVDNKFEEDLGSPDVNPRWFEAHPLANERVPDLAGAPGAGLLLNAAPAAPIGNGNIDDGVPAADMPAPAPAPAQDFIRPMAPPMLLKKRSPCIYLYVLLCITQP